MDKHVLPSHSSPHIFGFSFARLSNERLQLEKQIPHGYSVDLAQTHQSSVLNFRRIHAQKRNDHFENFR